MKLNWHFTLPNNFLSNESVNWLLTVVIPKQINQNKIRILVQDLVTHYLFFFLCFFFFSLATFLYVDWNNWTHVSFMCGLDLDNYSHQRLSKWYTFSTTSMSNYSISLTEGYQLLVSYMPYQQRHIKGTLPSI